MAYSDIKDPSAYFQTKLYTGTGSELVLTNDGNSDLQPDFLWIKNRTDGSTNHHAHNTNVASTQTLFVNKTDFEETQSQSVKSIQSDGFTLGTWGGNNLSSKNFVAWQWKANGGTTTSKSSGTVAGNVTTPCVQQVNTDAGFSILTYTASTSYAGTETHLEHGLGVGPKVLIVKRRDTTGNWNVYHAGNGASPNAGYGYLLLNTTNATQVASPSNQYWLNTPAESNATLLALGAENGANGGQYVCYAFAEKQGYSKFGKYVGNGSTNGPFVYTGFKPAFVMIKRTDSAANWDIFTGKISTFNIVSDRLRANLSDAEQTGFDRSDFVSNGFKIRNTNTTGNISGGTYIYMAFAENPFVAGGVPTTAR